MRNKYIKDFIENEEIQDFFLVKESGNIYDGKKGPYGSIVICDKTDEILCKIWGIKEYKNKELLKIFETLQPGDIIKIKGTTNLYQDKLQIIVDQLNYKTNNDIIDETDLYKTAPIDPNILYTKILQIINEEIDDIDYKTVCLKIYTTHKDKLLYWPAAKKYHHAYKGGLLWHTYRMLQSALNFSKVYTCLNKSLLLAGTALHDIGKILEMYSNEHGIVDEYTLEGNTLGHLVIGAMMINKIAKDIHMDKEKKLLLEHMIIAHHGDEDKGSALKPCIVEAYILHELDMIDMNMEKAESILENLDNGETEKNFSFNKVNLYKPTFFNNDYLKEE